MNRTMGLGMIGLALVLAACGTALWAAAGMSPTGEVAKKAAEIKADYWLNTKPLTLDGLKGKIVVLEFWATWCGPCRKSIPHMNELNKKYAGQGIVFIGLTDEPRDKVEPFAKEMSMNYPVGGGSQTLKQYGVEAIPTAFIVDPSGEVAWTGHPLTGMDAALEAQIKKTPPKPDAKPEGK
jgi:thiol-disulfide isomerase/thioredoxin